MFHLTTGKMQKAVAGGGGREALSLTDSPPGRPAEHLTCSLLFSVEVVKRKKKKKKKAKTERREAGVKATGRKERV